MPLNNPMISPFVGPAQANPPTDTSGVGGIQGPPTSPEDLQKRVNGWDMFLQKLSTPETGQTLMDFGFSLMGGRQPGETTGGLINRSYQTAQQGRAQREDRTLRRDAITAQTEATRASTDATRAGTLTPEERAARKEAMTLEVSRLREELKQTQDPEMQKLLRDKINATIRQMNSGANAADASAEANRAGIPSDTLRGAQEKAAVANASIAEFGADPTRLQAQHDAEIAEAKGKGEYWKNYSGGGGRGSADVQMVNLRTNARLAADPTLDRATVELEETERLQALDQYRTISMILQQFPTDIAMAAGDPVREKAVIDSKNQAIQMLNSLQTKINPPRPQRPDPRRPSAGAQGSPTGRNGEVILGREGDKVRVRYPDGSTRLMSLEEARAL